MLTPLQRIEIVATVKTAMNRKVTVEDVVRVEQGNWTESHPVSNMIYHEIQRLKSDPVSPDDFTTGKTYSLPENYSSGIYINMTLNSSQLDDATTAEFKLAVSFLANKYGAILNLVDMR